LPDVVAAEVARAVGLAEGARGVEAVVAAVARLEPVSVRALSRAADLPVPIVAAVCGELRKRGLVSEERPVQFTPTGRGRFGSAVAPVDASCPTCGGRGIALSPEVARLRRGLAVLSDAAPPPLVELDQCHCTPKTKLRRILALHAADAINGRRILLLGDDDLLSITLLRFVREFGGTIEQLVVADIDTRLLEFVARELEHAPFPVACIEWDVRRARAGCFDTVVTDPPYTATGGRLFLQRSIESLAGPGSQVFFSFGSRRPGVQFELQRAIAESGLEIRSLTRDFNEYVGAGALGGTSHLYHLAVPVSGRPLPGALYTGGPVCESGWLAESREGQSRSSKKRTPSIGLSL
jgi:N4-bis(aminopropyl)spermidine synthase